MTDLSQIIADLCAGLEGAETHAVSSFPETVSGSKKVQPIDNNDYFRSFQHFRSETGPYGADDVNRSENVGFLGSAQARASSYGLKPERPERPEIDSYLPLAEPLSLFPVNFLEPERPETRDPVAGAFPPPGDPLPISPAEVQAGVARELRALDDLGRTGPEALRDAIEITAAKVRNSAALAESQAMDGRCHVCRDHLDGTRPEVALMQGGSSTRLHIHSACHAAHKARRTALVDRIMTAAGYGAASTTKEIIP